MGANQPNVNKGNYAIKVVCIEERPIRRIFSPPYRLLIAIGIILIAIAEVVGAMWILQDDQARTVILVFLFLTLLTLIGLVYWWWLRVRVGTGSLGIVIGGEQPQFIQPGTFWLIPFTERLFDTVPTQPMTYNWRVEFRENETSVVPDIYQEILIQYQVAQGDPLKRAVLNRLALDGKDAGHPMPEYWLNQVSRGLQRYFEDLPPALVTDKIRNPETKIFEQEIQSTLQNLADAQGWGIQFPDVHTRYYHFKNGKG